ncbi:hypothetical protein KUW15_09930 [Qipengyuania aquimaris]|uniref:hypothetical protein n=1 Tax=Qipengyuania aquimaris TaxID=255984 RepID=UPI001C94F105|nr:hypothetical protein [Qipengyuania aquimaris]MBY6129033.1 hypothetical protein [Qipengyuania aquimaris]
MAIVIGALFFGGVLWAGDALKKHRPVQSQEFELVPGDQFTLRSRGWSGSELRAIFADFAKMYDIEEPRIVEGPGRIFSIDWPDGLAEAHILFAVNYLHYPRDFDLADRRILAAAQVKQGQLGGIPKDLGAKVFVPSDDTYYDRVHAVDDNGQAYLGDFGSASFVPIDDARMPRDVENFFR